MVDTATAGDVTRTRRSSPVLILLVVVLVCLATVPLVASAVRLGRHWVPQGDDATIALRGDDLFTAETPLLGMPSTVGDAVDEQVHHPGPLESQAIGVVAAVVDSPRVPLIVVTLVNLASVIVALAWARRLGGAALLAAAAAVVAALTWSLRGPILVTPFNPFVAVLPFLAFLVSLVAACDRQRWAVTSAVVFGSWAAEAHLTTTGPVGAAAVTALVIAGLRWARPRWRGQPEATAPVERRRLLVGVGAFVACWAFPMADALANEGGNPRAVLRASGSLEDRTLGTQRAFDVVVHAVSLRPVWAHAGAAPIDLLLEPSRAQYTSAAALAFLAVAAAILCRRDRPAVTTSVVLVAAALMAGAALMAKIPLGYFNSFALHNYLWLWPASAVLWVTAAAGVVHVVSRRRAFRPPAGLPLVAGLAVTALIAVAGVAPPHRAAGTAASTYVQALRPQVLDALDPNGAYLIPLGASIEVYGLGTGLVYALEHAGIDVRVPEQFEPSFGAHRVVDGADRQWLVVRIGHDPPEPPIAGAVPIASYVPPADLLDRRSRAEDAIVREIERLGGTTGAAGEEITPATARAWVESRGFLSARDFHLLEAPLAAVPAGDVLADLVDEPIAYVTVYLVPAP